MYFLFPFFLHYFCVLEWKSRYSIAFRVHIFSVLCCRFFVLCIVATCYYYCYYFKIWLWCRWRNNRGTHEYNSRQFIHQYNEFDSFFLSMYVLNLCIFSTTFAKSVFESRENLFDSFVCSIHWCSCCFCCQLQYNETTMNARFFIYETKTTKYNFNSTDSYFARRLATES